MAFSSVVLGVPPGILIGTAAGVPETAGPRSFPACRPGEVVAGLGALKLDDGRGDLWEESAPSGGNEEERSLCLRWVLPDQ
ncbi:hypothetical protein MRX96_009398 [Rhipicephalus microplus]